MKSTKSVGICFYLKKQSKLIIKKKLYSFAFFVLFVVFSSHKIFYFIYYIFIICSVLCIFVFLK